MFLLSLPLYEGVDWNFPGHNGCKKSGKSPSLRGSGLKFTRKKEFAVTFAVSLFTREWIEIISGIADSVAFCVSLFTREWIEIILYFSCRLSRWGLPLYEGVDWNIEDQTVFKGTARSPSLRGSGLKLNAAQLIDFPLESPSLRGSGLKYLVELEWRWSDKVSLFTREWIEIFLYKLHKCVQPVSLFTREWIEIQILRTG